MKHDIDYSGPTSATHALSEFIRINVSYDHGVHIGTTEFFTFYKAFCQHWNIRPLPMARVGRLMVSDFQGERCKVRGISHWRDTHLRDGAGINFRPLQTLTDSEPQTCADFAEKYGLKAGQKVRLPSDDVWMTVLYADCCEADCAWFKDREMHQDTFPLACLTTDDLVPF